MPKWFGKGCEYQCNQWEETEQSAGPDYKEKYPTLTLCNNENNPEDTEGNCTRQLCPLGATIVEGTVTNEVWTAVKENTYDEIYNEKRTNVYLELQEPDADIRLYIKGAFADSEQKLDCAKKLAERLNRCL